MKKYELDIQKFPTIKQFKDSIERLDSDLEKYKAIRKKLNARIKKATDLKREYTLKQKHLTAVTSKYMVEVEENFNSLLEEANAVKDSNQTIANVLGDEIMKQIDTDYDKKMMVYMGLKEILRPSIKKVK
jgi:DNA repair ATPase RecN